MHPNKLGMMVRLSISNCNREYIHTVVIETRKNSTGMIRVNELEE